MNWLHFIPILQFMYQIFITTSKAVCSECHVFILVIFPLCSHCVVDLISFPNAVPSSLKLTQLPWVHRQNMLIFWKKNCIFWLASSCLILRLREILCFPSYSVLISGPKSGADMFPHSEVGAQGGWDCLPFLSLSICDSWIEETILHILWERKGVGKNSLNFNIISIWVSRAT